MSKSQDSNKIVPKLQIRSLCLGYQQIKSLCLEYQQVESLCLGYQQIKSLCLGYQQVESLCLGHQQIILLCLQSPAKSYHTVKWSRKLYHPLVGLKLSRKSSCIYLKMAAWPEFYFDSEFESASEYFTHTSDSSPASASAVHNKISVNPVLNCQVALVLLWNHNTQSYQRSCPALYPVKSQPQIVDKNQGQKQPPVADESCSVSMTEGVHSTLHAPCHPIHPSIQTSLEPKPFN